MNSYRSITFLFLIFCVFQYTFALTCPPLSLRFRTLDGSCNNVFFKEWGKTETFFRVGQEGLEAYPWAHVPKVDPMPTYADLSTLPSDGPRGNARNISNLLCTRDGDELDEIDSINHSMFSVMFGQFVNHDLENNQFVESDNPNGFSALVTYVKDVNDTVCFDNLGNNVCLDPDSTIISSFARNSGGEFQPDGTFKTINNATSYLDLDLVYGRSEEEHNKLRSHTEGKLLVMNNSITIFGVTYNYENVLPNYLLTELPINNNLKLAVPGAVFTAGDQRVNENIALALFHTLWVREHNRVCDELMDKFPLYKNYPDIFDEVIFQRARSIVIAKYQHIVYEQYIPTTYGNHFNSLLGTYTFYNPLLNPSTSLPFASAAFRYGHFSIRDYHALDECGNAYSLGAPSPDPNVKIGLGMTAPLPFLSTLGVLSTSGGFENIIRGLINERAAPNTLPVDPNIQRALTSPTFVLDLVSLDIMRARFNHLPNYQKIRKIYHGLDPVTNNIYGLPGCPLYLETSPMIDDPLECYVYITGDVDSATELRNVYRKINNIDAIIGMTAEQKVPGSSFSRTSGNIIIDQFKRSRDGDRFFYKNILIEFTSDEVASILNTTMGELLRRNFDVDSEVPENPFETPENYRDNLISSCQ